MYVWSSMCLFVVLLIAYLNKKRTVIMPIQIVENKTKTSMFVMLLKYFPAVMQFETPHEQDSHTSTTHKQNKAVHEFIHLLRNLRTLFISLTLFLSVIILPIYIILGHYFKTYTHSYAWYISAAFLSGLTPTIVLIVIWTIFTMFFCWRCLSLFSHNTNDDNNNLRRGSSASDMSFIRKFCISIHWRTTTIALIIFIINAICVICANLAYVTALIYYNNTIKTLAQVTLALFKLFWSYVALPRMLLFMRYKSCDLKVEKTSSVETAELEMCELKYESGSETSGDFIDHNSLKIDTHHDNISDVKYHNINNITNNHKTDTNINKNNNNANNTTNNNYNKINNTIKSGGIWLEASLGLFNSIIVPCFVTVVRSVDCFYHVIIAAPEVQTNYKYANCQSISYAQGLCVSYAKNEYFVRYQPSFQYSYQCGSSLLTRYISVYLTVYILETFIYPLLRNIYDDYFINNNNGFVRIFRDMYSNSNNIRNKKSSKIVPTTTVNDTQKLHENNNNEHNIIEIQIQQLLIKLHFHRSRFCVRLLTNTAIFLTFGVLFPPLAVVIMFAICVQTYELQKKISYLHLTDNTTKSEVWLTELNTQLTNKFQYTAHQFSNLIWMLFPLISTFYAFFVFDTLGDQVGLKSALWAPILMSIIVYICMLYFMHFTWSMVRRPPAVCC